MRSGTKLGKIEGFFLSKIRMGDSSESKSHVSVGDGENGNWAGIEFSCRMKHLN